MNGEDRNAHPCSLYGLVLAGGSSRRMAQDKALLVYHSKPQVEWLCELLGRFCSSTFVSVRPDQVREPVRARLPLIVDEAPGSGPAGAILSAQRAHPQVAWLVVACDLPALDEHTLEQLLRCRKADDDATAFRSPDDGRAEPLCAIWEPSSHEGLEHAFADGERSPRRVLARLRTTLITPSNPRALANVNRPLY